MDLTKLSLRFNPTASYRSLGDAGIILMADSGQLYSTNASGAVFLDELQKGRSTEEAVVSVLDQFDVEQARLEEDLTELVEYLLKENVLAEVTV